MVLGITLQGTHGTLMLPIAILLWIPSMNGHLPKFLMVLVHHTAVRDFGEINARISLSRISESRRKDG